MRLRLLVPGPLQPAARRAYLRAGAMTAGLRLEPSFMVVGGQRCGTTSIFKALAEHPQVLRPPVEKGTDYFSLYYDRGAAWYRSHFPIAGLARRRAAGAGGAQAFEACTYYMFHPFALERIAHDFPAMKLVVMLRDPVERAFSAYKHEFARGFDPADSFERALDLEDERLDGELERMRADITYESLSHRHHAYVRRGQYAEQLERAFALFPRGQIHIMESEAFFADPVGEYAELTSFLALRPSGQQDFGQHNARPSSPMSQSAKQRLREHYAPHDDKLAGMLGRRLSWAR